MDDGVGNREHGRFLLQESLSLPVEQNQHDVGKGEIVIFIMILIDSIRDKSMPYLYYVMIKLQE